MYERKIKRAYNCALEVTMDVIDGKWKPYIICYLREGLTRPVDLHKRIVGVSRRVLNQQLRELEIHGIIAKKIYPVLPPKVEYYLTPLGEELSPVIDALEGWGRKYKSLFEEKLQNS